MNLIFVGPQGSGKGTQAKIIAEKLGLIHISTGDLFRSLSGELKKEVDRISNEGGLISNEITLKILQAKFSEINFDNFILDGFPRNLSQAKALEKIASIDKIIEISISDDESVKRISGRRNCPKCGKIYNIFTNPKPKKDGFCDDCKVQLNQRADDNPESIRKRLETYHHETEPILKNYKSIKVNGNQEIEKVTKEILAKLI